jgi:glycosyltransferase 2 family protein
VKKQKILTIAGLVISVLLLFLSLKDIKFQETVEAMKKADLRFVFIPTFFIFCAVTLSAFKWARITGNNVKVSQTFLALIIGLFVNNVLPARIGEVVRGYVLSKKTGISLPYAISTVLVDRIFDLVGLLLLTFIFFPKQSLPLQVSRSLYILVSLLIVLMAGLIIMSRERFVKSITGRLSRIDRPFFARLAGRVIEVQENLRRINSPLNLLRFVVIAFLQWLAMSSALLFSILTLGISINPLYVPFVCALLNMGLTVPSSPGYVGIYQFLLVYLLSIFGVPKHQGFAVSILFHASWYIPYNILGFLFLMKEHLKIKELKGLEEPNP